MPPQQGRWHPLLLGATITIWPCCVSLPSHEQFEVKVEAGPPEYAQQGGTRGQLTGERRRRKWIDV